MKRFFLFLLVSVALVLFIAPIVFVFVDMNDDSALATEMPLTPVYDLSGMSYNELVALKDQINLAMWNSEEWQEVTVPNGTWEIGVDIPAGHWTITADPHSMVYVVYGDTLNDNGKTISFTSNGYYATNLEGTEKNYISGGRTCTPSTDIDMKAGYYLYIDGGSVIFTPYSGKPDLGFK